MNAYQDSGKRPWKKYYSGEAQDFSLSNMGAQTIPEMLDAATREYGPRKALTTILPNGAQCSVTFSELDAYSSNFAIYLRGVLNLKAGDTVALMTANCIGFGVVSLGVARAGCIATHINPLYTPAEMAHQLNDSKAQVLIILDMFGDKADQVVNATAVKQVVTLSLFDFFVPLKRAFLGFVLKRVKKAIPPLRTSHITLKTALAAGQRGAAVTDVRAYTADSQPTDIALYQYTSGTTGRSKGAALSHQAVLANAYQGVLMTKGRMTPTGDTALVALPLYHITAYTLSFIAGLRMGAHSLLVPSPRPVSNLKSAFENYKVTWFSGINALFAALLTEEWFTKDVACDLRFCGSGGAAQTTGVAQNFEALTGVEIIQGYGMTECAGMLTLNLIENNRLGYVGIPVPGMEVRIVDDIGREAAPGQPGEVIARGPTLMTGYLNRPDETREAIVDGWLHTGDIGVMDGDGFLKIVDRKKDMILVSGFNVSPSEVEEVISQLSGVVQVGVVGLPDEKTGETPAAFVIRTDDALTEDMIRAACSNNLTNYKIPKLITFVEELPMTLTGKVLRRQLREDYGV